jgi:acylphosphatase
MTDRRLRLLVDGRVQGVGFRASTQHEARSLGLRGFVRNLYDGRVEVVAEGDEGALRKLGDFCRQGHPPARVTKVDEEWLDAQGEPPGFRISR